MLLLLVTAFALSADGFAAGLSFGLRGVRIGAGAKLTIALLSLLFAVAAVTMGTAAAAFLPNGIEAAIGGGILLLMGGGTAVRALLPEPPAPLPEAQKPKKFHLLGVTIMVIKDPGRGDVDGSGTIDLREALLLGFSLSVDMLGAGIGLALGGVHPLWLLPPMVGAVQILCLAAGEAAGRRFHTLRAGKRTLAFASGLLLAALGLARLFF